MSDFRGLESSVAFSILTNFQLINQLAGTLLTPNVNDLSTKITQKQMGHLNLNNIFLEFGYMLLFWNLFGEKGFSQDIACKNAKITDFGFFESFF